MNKLVYRFADNDKVCISIRAAFGLRDFVMAMDFVAFENLARDGTFSILCRI